MHPGPMNRGVEIAVDVASCPGRSITQQVANGVAVRMAVLFELLGAGANWRSSDDGDRSLIQRRRRCVDADAASARRRRARRAAARSPRSAPALDAATRRCSTRPGCVVSPGFVDLHTHLREPGGRRPRRSRPARGPRRSAGSPRWSRCRTPSRRTTAWRSSSRARARASAAGLCDVRPPGCITIGRAGEQLAPLGRAATAGVRVFTDDGDGVQDPL